MCVIKGLVGMVYRRGKTVAPENEQCTNKRGTSKGVPGAGQTGKKPTGLSANIYYIDVTLTTKT